MGRGTDEVCGCGGTLRESIGGFRHWLGSSSIRFGSRNSGGVRVEVRSPKLEVKDWRCRCRYALVRVGMAVTTVSNREDGAR